MSPSYPVDGTRLDALRATRSGRIALDGFEYQRAFAVLRLAALALKRPVPGAAEVPIWLRYDWGEDIDEVSSDGTVVLWQCKRGGGWAQPSRLVDVLVGFAPKWLWTPADQRDRLRFRLVTSDEHFAAAHDLPRPLDSNRADVLTRFREHLATPPDPRSDRAKWQAEADAIGHDALFDALWDATTVLYVSASTRDEGGVVVREAENTAVQELGKGRKVRDVSQTGAIVAALQALLTTAPLGATSTDGTIPRPDVPPRPLLAGDVEHRLFEYRPEVSSSVPVQRVDRTYLELRRQEAPPPPYVARRPEWSDVVRGADPDVRFLERTSTDALHAQVAAALSAADRGEGALRTLFVTGAPGAGKSTLALRVAARLVEAGLCVVADARFSMSMEEDPEPLLDAVRNLAEGGNPVLFLLDDPLGADSGWPRALHRLGRNAPRVVVLAASPDFLYDRHRAELRDVELFTPFRVSRPDRAEREALARLYPEADPAAIIESDDELLVLSMEAAADESFDDIIRRIWTTLADGQPLPEDVLGSQLPWPVVAFLAVTFFHRAYAPCPEPLLEAFLQSRADVGADATERLGTLRLREGWQIFRMEAPHRLGGYQGLQLFSMHARVARRAWELRPAPAWDIGRALAEASARGPRAARPLGIGMVALRDAAAPETEAFQQAVASAWTARSAWAQIETRQFAELCSMLTVAAVPLPPSLRAELRRRVEVADEQSWLAWLQLDYAPPATARPENDDEGPSEELIARADFSLAVNRATQFRGRLRREVDQIRFERQLWRAFDGDLSWSTPPVLLAWLIARGDQAEVRPRLPAVRAWLADHPDDTSVRTAFVGVLGGDPALAREHLPAVRAWLAEHRDDTSVRTAFVGVIGRHQGLVTRGDVEDALAFCRSHADDQNVRAPLLLLLSKMGSSELAGFLEETLGVIGGDPTAGAVGGAALKVAAVLPAAHATLMARWLEWGATAVRTHQQTRSVQSIVTSLVRPFQSLREQLRRGAVPPEAREGARAALEATRDACLLWGRIHGVPTPAFRGPI